MRHRKAAAAATRSRCDRQPVDPLARLIDQEARSARAPRQGRLAKTRHRGIPRPDSPGASAITDGVYHVGTVLEAGHSFFSFGPDEILIGDFETRAQAIADIPPADPGRRP
jgi:hypothetical protein